MNKQIGYCRCIDYYIGAHAGIGLLVGERVCCGVWPINQCTDVLEIGCCTVHSTQLYSYSYRCIDGYYKRFLVKEVFCWRNRNVRKYYASQLEDSTQSTSARKSPNHAPGAEDIDPTVSPSKVD